MILRDYQTDLINRVYEAWNSGKTNLCVQLATGGGKTIIFSKIMSEFDGISVAIAHRIELVSQISLTLARYGIRHNIIAAKSSIREIIALHMFECGRSFYHPGASRHVIGVDTLVRKSLSDIPWADRVGLVIQDEGHHTLRDNKWGRAAAFFPNARGLYPTATPTRSDGHGLGRHADGIMDTLLQAVSMRELIQRGYLTEYRIFAPPSELNLLSVPLSAGGDYSPPKLRDAVHKSHITGDVVDHYLRIAPGKLGVTFAVDINAAAEIASAFRARDITAEVISSKTPDLLRANIMRRFRNREIMQLVNVDLLGEGVDIPAIECVSFARPTASYTTYVQQFGRALRPLEGKTHAIIIDHVGNVVRHGLPDGTRLWTLDRRERLSKTTFNGVPLRTCLNPVCCYVYSRLIRECPNCGLYTPPADRSKPEYVDGDLHELDPTVLAALRGEIERIGDPPRIPHGASDIIAGAIAKNHRRRQEAQLNLREFIAAWAGRHHAAGETDSQIHKRFYFSFGIDILTAQTLNTKDAIALCDRILTETAI